MAVLGTGNTPNAYGSLAIGKVGANPTSGTTLANIRLNGGSVGTGRGAEINAIADANWSDGSSHPTYLTFSTVASSSTSATERIRVHAGGNVDIKTGNLVISTAGKGIDFSATSDAGGMASEVLDDYEEGTWTVSAQSGHSFGTPAGTVKGRYVKIGKVVNAWAEFGTDTSGNIAVNDLIYVGSLPYAKASAAARASVSMTVNYSTGQSSTVNQAHLAGTNDLYGRISQTTGHPRSGAGYYLTAVYETT